LLKTGWRPHRSIWICSWDAEEPDEFGSTMWTDKHSAELTNKAIAYLDLDSAVGGDRFVAAAAPSLKRFMLETAADVPDPMGGSVLKRANEQLHNELLQALTAGSIPSTTGPTSDQLGSETEPRPISEQTIEIGNLGSGTDFVSFFDHLGIPSTEFGFDGPSGIYHSVFDDYQWMETFGDPHFVYHVAAARFYGLEVLRLSGAELLPFDYEQYGREIQKYVVGVRTKLALLGQGWRLDFGPAMDAAQKLIENGKNLRQHFQSMLADETQYRDLHRVNRALVDAEKGFLLANGLPGRPWFKHAIFAPAFYNGYEAAVLPGVLESIDGTNWNEARQQLRALTAAVNLAANTLSVEENPK
jgi:N-acetylated-alpha-linked acidic dipeptidase